MQAFKNMKAAALTFGILLSAVLSISAHAEQSLCWKSITVALNQKSLWAGEVINCLDNNENVQKVLPSLCLKDQSQLTEEFSAYLDYQSKYRKAYEAWVEATNITEKNSLFTRQLEAERDWVVYGYKNELDYVLFGPILFEKAHTCEKYPGFGPLFPPAKVIH